jgi:hypothetical protein
MIRPPGSRLLASVTCAFGVNGLNMEAILLVTRLIEAGDAQRRPERLNCSFDPRHGVPKEEVIDRRPS